MSGLRIGIFGNGRLGAAIAARAGHRLRWQVARQEPPAEAVDAAIEASSGAAVAARLHWALETSTPLVIGSTGWQMEDLAARVGDRIGVVVAPNFSLTVALVQRLTAVIARFCAADPERDPYLFEHHQARKHDAPSGTARMLCRTILANCARKTGWKIGQPADGALPADQLSVAVLRAGTTYSEHRIGVDAPAEVLELRHTARSAAAFADGALLACEWIQGRKGVHTMDAVASSALDPLFRGLAGASEREVR